MTMKKIAALRKRYAWKIINAMGDVFYCPWEYGTKKWTDKQKDAYLERIGLEAVDAISIVLWIGLCEIREDLLARLGVKVRGPKI